MTHSFNMLHMDLEILMGILQLKALPSICLAFKCGKLGPCPSQGALDSGVGSLSQGLPAGSKCY